MQIGIMTGIYADKTAQLRTALPRNLVPVLKESGLSKSYLGPAEGIVAHGTGPGIGRGSMVWNGVCYSVMGSKLVRVDSDGSVTTLADVDPGGEVSLDVSFDRLAIASNQKLFYWDGALSQVTDPDLGVVVDMLWIAGYFMTTDGTSIIVTDIDNPYAVNPLRYGSSEADPDPIVALKRVRSEVVALNRYSIETFQNVGGDGFPFARIDGAQIQRGCVGTKACAKFLESVAFLGSARNEAPAVWIAASGTAQKLSTREVDTILQGYSEGQLALAVLETRADRGQQHLYVHLPDRTLVFDGAASELIGDPVWFELGSSVVGHAQYRARHFAWAYDRWLCDDPQSPTVGRMSNAVATHYDAAVGWDFGTAVLYNEGRGAIVHELELICLPGNVPLGAAPVIWTSYSSDGQVWSQERPVAAGKIGERDKRICWRKQGFIRNWRIQRFRGTSDAFLAVLRLEMRLEPLQA